MKSMAVPTPSRTESRPTYEPVIGLEVHVQLNTRSKAFCACSTRFGAPPNSQTCPVCLGLPGAMPVLNREAVAKAVAAGLALGCQIAPRSIFARKNYFYPDLPKGYQISQYDRPLAEAGGLDIPAAEGAEGFKRIGITRVHLEEDAGKSMHDGHADSESYSYVDLNRSGVPLIEIVSEPDLRSPQEAYAYLIRLKELMLFLDVSDCNMEEGSLRCDANVSIRPRGTIAFGAKIEIKNLNSFRYLQQALEHEIERQAEVLDGGGRLSQETRLFDPHSGKTSVMRSKEQAHDYRYFPEPDLPPLEVSPAWREEIAARLPELPEAKRRRWQRDWKLPAYDTEVLTASPALAAYTEAAAGGAANPKGVANWIMGDLTAQMKARGEDWSRPPVQPAHLSELVELVDAGTISGKMAKQIFETMVTNGQSPREIVAKSGARQISDPTAIDAILEQVLAANPQQVEQYRSGKTAVLGYLVGQAMKASRGQANPALVQERLKQKLA